MHPLPDTDQLPVRHLAGALGQTTNSYKFYWLLAILRHVQNDGAPVVAIDDLLGRMIVEVWYPVCCFRLSFGKQDRLARLVGRVRAASGLADDAKPDATQQAAAQLINSDQDVADDLRSLGRFVPFRFLTPWFENDLRGRRDHKKNGRIEVLARASFDTDEPTLYRFTDEPARHIELHPAWLAYLKRHLRIVGDFCLWNLLGYLRGRNPNVPNIAGKLFRPETRNLHSARRFWNLFLDETPTARCLYSGAPLAKGHFDVDHFLPWSFVSHDQIWNLAPVTSAANASKSDALPDFDAYFERFAAMQRAGFKAAFEQDKKNWLEDYALLFVDDLPAISNMSEDVFRQRLRERVAPLAQIAANMGFPSGWTYQP